MTTTSTFPWPVSPPGERERRALADAEPRSFWLDAPKRPDPAPPLEGSQTADLVVVGGGLAGLWTAILARQDDPSRDVVLLEAERVAFGASGRNGGFVSSSLTHGLGNGLARFPDELPTLERLGGESFAALVQTVERSGIDCGLELTGDVVVALEPHEEEWLVEAAGELRRFGHEAELLDRDAVRAELGSPLYRSGLWHRSGSALVDPARLSFGLARLARELGVRIHEQSRVTELREVEGAVEVVTSEGVARARGAVLTTGAYRPLVRASRQRIVPVYDYVIVSEPLGADQRAAIGWRRRQGFSDAANHFHYYRLTADDRILWGGYDALYHYGNAVGEHLEQRDAVHHQLAQHLFTIFPQLEGLRFTHRWAGAIDTCSRFSVFFGTSHGGRVAYAAGYTGLGVGASRFGARVALDVLDGRDTLATRLRYVRRRPPPFPPEPLRWAAIELTRRELMRADQRHGRRGPWLRTLDRLGFGFDS